MNTLSYQRPLSDICNTWQSTVESTDAAQGSSAPLSPPAGSSAQSGGATRASPSDKATNKLRANRQATG